MKCQTKLEENAKRNALGINNVNFKKTLINIKNKHKHCAKSSCIFLNLKHT